MAPPHPAPGTQSWILVITELHRYQGVGYKSDIVVISGSGPSQVTLREYFKIFRVVVSVVSWGLFFFHVQETNLSSELYFINIEIEIDYERKLINNAIMIFLHGMPLHWGSFFVEDKNAISTKLWDVLWYQQPTHCTLSTTGHNWSWQEFHKILF